ncbi:MAG: hypothetical protein SGPRY_002540 [Prymnesium sp.]
MWRSPSLYRSVTLDAHLSAALDAVWGLPLSFHAVREASFPRIHHLNGTDTLLSGSLDSVGTHALHHPTVLDAICIKLWLPAVGSPVGGAVSSVSPCGQFTLKPAKVRREESVVCVLQSSEKGGASLQLSVKVEESAPCSFAISLAAPHWLVNHSSLPLSLYSAGGLPIVQAASGASAVPFSLPEEQGNAVNEKGNAVAVDVCLTEAGRQARKRLYGSAAPPSRPFPVAAVGDSGSLQVVCEDTTIAELAVLTTRPPKGFELADFTVVEIRDLYELYNYTSSPIAFQPAPPAVPAPRGSKKQPPEATVTIIQPGSMAVLRWHSQSREFILRPCEAAEANCSRFSMPDSKHPLVPQPRSKTTDRPTDRPQLPCYSRARESPEARWELLGAGEACEYSLDAPSKPHVLQLVACATDGSLTASWTEPADGEEGAHCLSLEKLDHLHEHAFAEKQGHPTSKLISLPLSAEGERTSEVDDISSPTCDLRSWLCISQTVLTFIFFSPKLGASFAAQQAAHAIQRAQRAKAAGPASPALEAASLPLCRLPLAFKDVQRVEASASAAEGKQLLTIWSRSGEGVVLGGLRELEWICARVHSLLDAVKAAGTYQHKLDQIVLAMRKSKQRATPPVEAPATPFPAHKLPHPLSSLSTHPLSAEGAATLVQSAFRRWHRRLTTRFQPGSLERLHPNSRLAWLASAEEKWGWSSELVEATWRNDLPRVSNLLFNRADPNSFDSRGRSVLHIACLQRSAGLVRELVRAGSDIELPTRDFMLQRPLHLACSQLRSWKGAEEVVGLLVEVGADVGARRVGGQRALDLVPPSSFISRQLIAAEKRWASGQRANKAALVYAPSRVSALLRHGADPDSIEERGVSALEVAVAKDALTILSLLLSAGASVNRPTSDTAALTPLHLCASTTSSRCTLLLLRASASPSALDGSRRFPHELCGPPPAHQPLSEEGLLLASRAAAVSAILLRALDSEASVPLPSSLSHSRRSAGGGGAVMCAILRTAGPTVRELRIWQRRAIEEEHCSQAGLSPMRSSRKRLGMSSGAGGEEKKGEGSPLSISVEILGLGLSLVDEEPIEVLYLSLLDVRLLFVDEKTEGQKQIAELSIGQLQARAWIHNASAGESLKLVIVRRSDLSELLYLEQISVGVQPLRLSLEQNTLTRLLRLADSISISAAQILTSDVPYEASDAPADAPSSSPPTRIDSSAQRIYVKQLRLHPLVVNLTVQLAALTDEPALQPFHPTNKLVGLAKNIASINKATLRLDALHLDEANLSPAEWAERLGWHYTLQLLQSVYKLLGSLDFLGNPAAVFADVRGGFRAFFYEPSKGLVQSPVAFVGGVAKGTRGLAGGVAGGVSAGFMGVFSTGFKHVGTLAGGLALDPQFERNFEQAYRSHTPRSRQEKSSTSKQGFRTGRKLLADGFLSGFAGIVQQPVRGALSGGSGGFVNGLGRGLVGAVTKPVAGVAGFASKWSEGIASDAKKLTPDGMREARMSRVLRVRQPRLMSAEGVLCAYPPTPADLPTFELETSGDRDSSVEEVE